MADANDLCELALALPGVASHTHFDRTAFKAKRIFVTLAADGLTANFRFAPDEQELKCVTHPAAFAAVPNAWGKQGWTTGVLEAMSRQELAAALAMAHAGAVDVRNVRKTRAPSRDRR